MIPSSSRVRQILAQVMVTLPKMAISVEEARCEDQGQGALCDHTAVEDLVHHLECIALLTACNAAAVLLTEAMGLPDHLDNVIHLQEAWAVDHEGLP